MWALSGDIPTFNLWNTYLYFLGGSFLFVFIGDLIQMEDDF